MKTSQKSSTPTRYAAALVVLFSLLAVGPSPCAFAGGDQSLSAPLRLTPDSQGLIRASGSVKWRQIDQAMLTSASISADVPDETVWDVYMYTSPLSLEPIYVGQVTFTHGRGRMTTCSGDAQPGYVIRVFDFDFVNVLEGTFK